MKSRARFFPPVLGVRLTLLKDLDKCVEMYSRRISLIMFLLIADLRLSLISCNANPQQLFSFNSCLHSSSNTDLSSRGSLMLFILFLSLDDTLIETKARFSVLFLLRVSSEQSVLDMSSLLKLKTTALETLLSESDERALKAAINKDLAEVLKKQLNGFLAKKLQILIRR